MKVVPDRAIPDITIRECISDCILAYEVMNLKLVKIIIGKKKCLQFEISRRAEFIFYIVGISSYQNLYW